MSEEYSFTTLPLPSPASYPSRVAIVGDIGLTENSSATLDHIKLNDPSILLVIGDLSYANNYLTTGESAACYSCSFPTAPTRETYQPHWDNWGRYSFYSGLALAQFFGGFCTLKIVGVVMHILT
jgi:hypothetical protein